MLTESADTETADRTQQILSDFKDKRGRYKDHWDPIYKETDEHLRFTELGKQFKGNEANTYGLKNPVQPNLLLTYANHEANKTLQTDYRGKVSPNGGGANPVKARERQDVLRGLMRTNNFRQIANLVRRKQVMGGISYSMAKLDYANKRGFGKTLSDEFVDDYRNVYPDITVKSCTFADMRDFIIRQEVQKSQWEEMTGEKPEGWGSTKKKNLWHYWVREDQRDAELLKEDGKTVMGSTLELDEEEPDYTGIKMDEDGEPLSRPTTDSTWCWYKITEDDRILDEEKWLGSYPPLVACTGRKVTETGDDVSAPAKTYYQPLTQFAETAQKIYTIIANIIALRLSKSPFSKWKIAFESINVKDMVDLRKAAMVGDMDIVYKSMSDDGQRVIPAPEEIEPHILDALLISLQQEQERIIQKIFGIFDANLGEKSNEQSGVAIERRAQGGDLSNYDLQFNYMEWVEQVTRVKLDLIPKYLTAPQQMAFVDEDDNVVMDWINTTNGKSFSPDEEYSLSIEAMPISPTAREDESLALMNIMKAAGPIITENPQAVALIVKAQPGRYSAQIADFIAQGDPKMKEAQQTIQQLQGELQKVTQQAQTKQAQDAQTIQMLKGASAAIKQQMQLLKRQHALEGQSAEAMAANEAAMTKIQGMLDEIDEQTKQYVAINGRIAAEAAMLKVVGALAAPPEPVTPKPGGSLP